MKGKMGSFETVKKRTFEREEEDAERDIRDITALIIGMSPITILF